MAEWWLLELECGHRVTRRVQTRRTFGGERIEDPRPTWAYCKACLEDARAQDPHHVHRVKRKALGVYRVRRNEESPSEFVLVEVPRG